MLSANGALAAGINFTSAEHNLSSTSDPNARCGKSTLTQEKFVGMLRAIAMHGDLTDKAFIEKTLGIKFKEEDPEWKGIYNADPIPGTQIRVALYFLSGKKELDFDDLGKSASNFQDCGYLTKETFNQVFGGAFEESEMPLESRSGGGMMHLSGFLYSASQDMKGKNNTIITVGYTKVDKSNIISSAKIRQNHNSVTEGK